MSSPKDYFAGRPDRVEALRRACETWEGTPFRKHSRVKGPGGGVDCESFVPCALAECGAISGDELESIEIPEYTINHAEHSDRSMFEAWFRRPDVRRRVRLVQEDEPHVDGDFVFPRVGLCTHHIGFRIGNDVYHIARPSGYCVMTVAQLDFCVSRVPSLRGMKGLHLSRYRLMEAEWSGGYVSGGEPVAIGIVHNESVLPISTGDRLSRNFSLSALSSP